MRLNIDPDDLIPKLPKPKDLHPFPTSESIIYEGHSSLVRSISLSPTGQWLVSGGDDCTVKFWEVDTGRCTKTIETDFKVYSVAWCPNPSAMLVAVACENDLIVINPSIGNANLCSSTDVLLSSYKDNDDEDSSLIQWTSCSGKEFEKGFRIRIQHKHGLKQVTWHGKGDYFATVMPDGGHASVLIHQLSKRKSQNPLKKIKGKVQKVLFHPTHPHFLVATQQYVRIYNLVKQELTKKLVTGVKWISSMDVHPKGDNVIIGSYDQRLCWFDLDLSSMPYKTLRHHKKAVRQVSYHRRYPLFASASDDGTVVIFHGMVYSDLMQNPLIVPVKILRGHKIVDQLGVLDCLFHPSQPWIFTAGADKIIRLFT
ncbi:ribosome biogenesis protein bop1-like [Oscarella lobularis]|uniref:ribosome biogenesis protein bop1-like n=1 Tax=Oscarella lobularis TaxID=121494 RepID=UPI0033131469